VPVFYHPDPEVGRQVLGACYRAGVRVFEFTNRGDFAHELFAQLVRHARAHLPELMLGAGTVVDAPTAGLYIQSGADFIVSPVLSQEVAAACNRRKVMWSPGCGSLTEISRAEELGAEVVKIFPALQVGGPAFVAAVKGPCPWTSIMPTGGVEPREENLREWFGAGAHCVGMGSQLIGKELIAAQDYAALEQNVHKTLQIIKKVRHV